MATQQHEDIAVGQLGIRWLLTGDGSEDSISLFEFSVPSQAKVPVAHSHDGYDETIYGLEGVLTWTVAGDANDVGVGDVLRIPRGVVHKFENRVDLGAKALAIITPGLLGPDYFRDIAAVLTAGPPDPAALGEVMRRHGLTPVPD